ncbi:MAG: phospholipase [Leptospiraceae bacterium]|nr:phospholipase [Leptospiraceae bacterium]
MRGVAKSLSILAIAASPLFSWSNHFLYNREALSVLPELANAQPVRVELLEDFLLKEQEGLSALLDKVEAEAKESYAKYAPQPPHLAFRGGDASNIRQNFLRALRINPNTPLGYYLQQLPGKKPPGKIIDPNKVSIFGEKDIVPRYIMYEIKKGDLVHPLDVVATAGDEPDFGIDINLFIDNDAEFSKDYGFGKQSFGDPKLYYGSQAPFHIGYYHEAGIIFLAAGFLKRTYPRYRVHQFLNLARYALKTGHPYWGYRFLGWGLHYIGDLTQPYHARVLPNYGALSMLWINTKAIFGFPKAKNEAIDRISSRHTTIENYVFQELVTAYKSQNTAHPILAAVRDTSTDAQWGEFDGEYIVEKLTKESVGISDELDTLIDKANLLKGFSESNELPERDPQAIAELNLLLARHFRSVGAHTRNYVRAGLRP